MTASVVGTLPYNWSIAMTPEGREYTIQWKVVTTSKSDGPDIAITASGLPLPGSYLNVGNTVDPWAFYQRKASASILNVDANGKTWSVEQKFSTIPIPRCNNFQFDDPLLEPPKVRGSFNKFFEEAVADKDGNPIVNSANQRIKGPLVQRATSRPVIELEMNVAWLNLPFLAQYVEAVNSGTWWGMAARTIKCTDFTWEQLTYGKCYKFFHVTFSFEIKNGTWDVTYVDEGTRVKVAGSSPARYVQYKDALEENAVTLLDGAGNALDPGDSPVYVTKRVQRELDFSAVGWPAVLL